MPRLAFTLLLLLAAPLAAQDDWGAESPCGGVLDLPAEELAQTLAKVPKYASTYVVVTTERVEGEVASADSPALQGVEIAVYEGSPAAAIAEHAGLTVKTYPFAAAKIVEELLAGNADAAILWSPLAGLGALELDFDYALSFRTAGAPAPRRRRRPTCR
jgi:ABC-type amino acid transport substrate-binding protein